MRQNGNTQNCNIME